MELLGNLILLFTGFILSILTISLSIFNDGIRNLRDKYENEKKQTIENISQIAKKTNLNNVQIILTELSNKEKETNRKLRYLTPQKLLLWNGIPFALAFVFLSTFIFTLTLDLPYKSRILLSIASLMIVSFGAGLYHFYKSIFVIIEASDIYQQKSQSRDITTRELLTRIVENTKHSSDLPLFVKPEKVKVYLDGIEIKDKLVISHSANRKRVIKVTLLNSSDLMLKNNELGLGFPPEFLIERTEGDNITSLYTGGKQQIVRFNDEYIHSHERNNLGEINVTFLKAGEYDVDFFVKAENLVQKRVDFKLKIVD